LYITDVEISEEIADKIAAKHNVSEREVYELFENPDDPLIIRRSQKVKGRHIAFGRTYSGRYLVIPFVLRDDIATVVSARDMTDRERRLYLRS
jgi:uncharacterized DUF497 family protein